MFCDKDILDHEYRCKLLTYKYDSHDTYSFRETVDIIFLLLSIN